MNLTNDKRQLIEIGSRLRGGYLIEQANYTLALARQSPEVLSILPNGFMEKADKAVAAVEKGMRDRANAAAEAKDASRVQNATLRQVREWRRKLAALGRMAKRMGAPVPAPLTTIGGAVRNVPAALQSLQESIGLLKENARLFESYPLYQLVLGEAESLATSLAAVDAAQETKLLAARPEAVRKFYFAKATLYTFLKDVNDTARAIYAGDAATAARFNLSLLYRAAGRALPPAEPASPQA